MNSFEQLAAERAKKVGSFARGFRDFAFKGNIVDLAVGVIIGAAFTGLITSFVKNVLMPLIALVILAADDRGSRARAGPGGALGADGTRGRRHLADPARALGAHRGARRACGRCTPTPTSSSWPRSSSPACRRIREPGPRSPT